MIMAVLKEADDSKFLKKGKNIYVINEERKVSLTINSFTKRLITADKLNEKTKGLLLSE